MKLLLQAGMLSFDSLIVSLALGPLVQSTSRRWRMAALFGVCDGFAFVIGAALVGFKSFDGFSRAAVPALVLVCGVYLLIAAYWNKFRANPRVALALPIVMSLDNLAYGLSFGGISGHLAANAVLFAAASFVLAYVGLFLGGLARQTNPRATERLAGFALIAACMVLCFS